MTQTAQLKTGPIFKANRAATTPIVVNQGGTSSGKTWSILQLLIVKALKERLHISVCADTMPHLKKGALKDFISILTELGIYNEADHNKTDNIFKIGESRIEFFSLDSAGKAHGPRRDIVFINEANQISFSIFVQLNMRTDKQVFIDFNPAEEDSWIYSEIIEKMKAGVDYTFIKSTYLDNPFLSDKIVKDIEFLKTADESLWTIYGLGERATLKTLIYSPWDVIDTMPDPSFCDEFYGLDFGFNVPTALVRCLLHDGRILYTEELLYQSGLTNQDLIGLLKAIITNNRVPIYADNAEPQRIMEIQRAGFNCRPADKSVKDGIDRVKRLKINVTKGSTNLIKERKSYKWKEGPNGEIYDEPVKFNDHALDALRYAVHSHLLKPSGKYCIV